MLETIREWLTGQGFHPLAAEILSIGLAITLVVILSFLANLFTKRFILKGVARFSARTETKWDDLLLQKKIFTRFSHLVPALVIYTMAPLALVGHEQLSGFATTAALIYMVFVGILILDSFLSAFQEIYRTFEVSREVPIKGFIQVLKIGIYFVAGLIVISIILDKPVFYLLGGLGALAAVLMLVFKDSILGFVAGVQLAANKLVAPGDWIEMPKYGADGDVLEVALTTVKVQNFDKTITTIPTYALISDSFKNWRGMEESEGRRIKRAIFIDINTIKLCSEEMLGRFSKIQYIAEYIERKTNEIADHNLALGVDDSTAVNGRRLTNIGTFRAYLIAYLKNHPQIHQDMTFLIRQLAPTEHGLPLEIYVFCKDQAWANYEAIQADIFDHLLAVVPEFDLRVFQSPAGSDFREVIKN